jgi:transposase-like protein
MELSHRLCPACGQRGRVSTVSDDLERYSCDTCGHVWTFNCKTDARSPRLPTTEMNLRPDKSGH